MTIREARPVVPLGEAADPLVRSSSYLWQEEIRKELL
jgi:hypothetical protein